MKRKSILGLAAALSVFVSAVPCTVSAEGSVIYGTMNIPYADFYAAEFGTSPNAYEVDAYSSATTTKWSKNGAGELFEGTYNQPNENGTGSILGVTYPVAITQNDLDSLGGSNYNFTKLDTVPTAYKNVTVTDGKASFSAVQDNTPETASDTTIKLSTATPWGDYLMDFENKPEMGAIYGALIKTDDGKTYAMRHEENIWRGELAWSSGIRTSEAHGNALSYEHFIDLMGATVTEVTFITADGYVSVPTETYVPVKFVGEVKIENGVSGTGSTAFTLSGFPEDFDKEYNAADSFTVSDNAITYNSAMPGSYTLTVSDKSGKYADYSGTFTLSTDEMPAAYTDKKLVKAEGASDAEFANFLKNIAKVTVGENTYSASGKGAVKIIKDDGTIDLEAASRGGNVFDGSGNYKLSVQATGYNAPLEFEINDNENNVPEETEPAVTTTTTTAPENVVTTTTTASVADNDNTAETTTAPEEADDNEAASDVSDTDNSAETPSEAESTEANNDEEAADETEEETSEAQTSDENDSPKTGDAGAALPIAGLAFAGIAAASSKRKKK